MKTDKTDKEKSFFFFFLKEISVIDVTEMTLIHNVTDGFFDE